MVLRNEFTISLARFIASNPEIKLPFKRYQIGQVFRDGPMKLGRYREFWQCDADCVGISDVSIDSQLLMLAQDIFKKLNLSVVIKLNNRLLLNAVLDKFSIDKDIQKEVIISIDKLDKIEISGVMEELSKKGISEQTTKEILNILNIDGNNQEKIEKLKLELGDCEGLQQIAKTLSMVDQANIVFSPSLARGLAYYTGNVFEVFLNDNSQLSSSLGGGGRYDDMIGGLTEKIEKVPAIGISFGLDTIFDTLKLLNKIADVKSVVEIYLVAMGDIARGKTLEYAQVLRKNSIKTDLDLQSKKLNKCLEYVNSNNIKWVGIVGEDEIKRDKIMLRNMQTGKQKLLSLKKVIKEIK